MSNSVPPSEAETLAGEQAQKYEQCVGKSPSMTAELLQEAFAVAQELEPKPFYLRHPLIRFVWELLDTEGHSEPFRHIVDAWMQDDRNLQRAARIVKREFRAAEFKWSGYAVFKMKPRKGLNWSLLNNNSRLDPTEPDPERPLPQTLVCIALAQLDYTNGFFLPLEAGQDVCVDSAATIMYPPTGGGIGLAIWLKL